ncbi:hypothetical protein NPIL_636441 [Nephila pilipes]|uniref:Uncharacterized protein n=1 Tax=Nephila pilipes TaxID=299642 RepID=A0A8X6P9B9_NEPPI|nr:hypothetical protein NPIL_636441 [Nephila pilipes]
MRLIESKFGFVVAGSYNDESFNEESFSPNHCFLSKGVRNLDKTLRSFWEMESISGEKPAICDELKFCEDQFERTLRSVIWKKSKVLTKFDLMMDSFSRIMVYLDPEILLVP